MPVHLDDNDNPAAWGDSVVGEDIPDPPSALTGDSEKQAQWDRQAEEWVEDTGYVPTPTIRDRVESLEDATGIGEDPAKRGIAKRIDDLEDRIKALEDKQA